jgi:hypothetical protein
MMDRNGRDELLLICCGLCCALDSTQTSDERELIPTSLQRHPVVVMVLVTVALLE